jgi:DNA ligase-1
MTASWIHKLNESDSRLHKESVLDKALVAAQLGSSNAQIFLGLTKATYNSFTTWGVAQVPNSVGIVDAENPWQEFNQLLIALASRRLTGNAARDAIEAMMLRFDSDEWNAFCAAVLRKDLRCGISEKTVNKVCKGTEWEIPVFGCQLATNCEDRPEMRGLKRLEPKLDGVRMLLQVIPGDDGTITTVCYSRNGKVFDNFGHIQREIEDNYNHMIHKFGLTLSNGFVLDGEVMGRSFQDLMRQARRKENVATDDTVYHVFDILPLDDFRRGYWNAQQYKRVEILESMRPIITELNSVTLVPHIDVYLDTAEGKDVFERYCNDKVAEGFEGVMIKSMDAPYQSKRSTSWLKYKPVITVDLEVIDVEEGTGKNVGRLGALVCSGVDNGKTITVNVGSGFRDDERNSLWDSRDVAVGRIVEVMADAVTQNQDGSYSLRFPRFVRFRDTLTGEKE